MTFQTGRAIFAPMKIVVTGATGFIGTRLCDLLRGKGHYVDAVSLRRDNDWEKKVMDADAVVNLAGESVFGKRWNTYVKSEIHESRIQGTRKIVEAMGKAHSLNPSKEQILVNASAIGYYGSDTDEAVINEASEAGTDFLAFVCREWEEEAQKASLRYNVRTTIVRIGVVLGKNGGALESMLYPLGNKAISPFKMGLGGPINSGKQWMSWVHLDDVCGMIIYAIENSHVKGVMNATSPNPVRNIDFTKTLGAVINRPVALPLPGIALHLLFGEAAAILTGGQKVLPEAAEKAGYKFKYSALHEALKASL